MGSSPDRRRFLKRLGAGAAGAAALPSLVAARDAGDVLDHDPPELPAAPPGVDRDEAYWRAVSARFTLRDGLVLLNAANLCPAPISVQRALLRHTRQMDADPSFQNRARFSDLREDARAALARYLGADADEVALVRNTSEANNTVVHGLELGPGDEVVLWDQNHPTNNVAWDVRAERLGFRVRRVTTPPGTDDPGVLSSALLAALSPSTRLLAFSHVSNVSGVALPAADLCHEARKRDVATLVDGAQTFGALRVTLHEMGCDFYSGSAHKWLMGPREAGVLYVRRERVEELWAADVGVGWASALEGGARKFETLGQRDDAALAALNAAVGFHERVGPDAVEARVRELATTAMGLLRERVPGVSFHTPGAPESRAGVVVFDVEGMEGREAFDRLYTQHGVAGAPRGEPFPGLRFSPHVYNTVDQLDRAVEAVAAVA